MKRFYAALLALVLLLALMAGCATEEERGQVLSGTYMATACQQNGEDAGLEGEYILLDNDGDGRIYFGGVEYDFTWTLEGSAFSFEDEDGDAFTGRYHAGRIEGSYYGYDWVFELDGVVSPLTAGTYQAVYCADGEGEYWCDGDRLELEADGRGWLVFENEEYRLNWSLEDDAFCFEASDAAFEGRYYPDGGVTVDGVDYREAYIEGVFNDEYDYIFVLDAASVKPEIAAGMYEAVSCTQGSNSYICDEDWILIGADGRGTFAYEGEELAIDWSLDGSVFTFEDEDGNLFDGYYYDGTIEGCYGDTYDYIFEAAEGVGAAQRPLPTGDFSPVSGRVGDHKLSVLGAEHFEDWDGEEAIRFYYEFTNGSDETMSAGYDIMVTALQNGEELEYTFANYDEYAPEDGHEYLDVRPGVSIRCVAEFNYEPSDGAVVFLLQDWGVDETLEAVFDPARLPGRPAGGVDYAPVSDPVTDLPDSGVIETGRYTIESMELTEGWEDEELIRIYCLYENNGDEDNSFFMDIDYRAMQDGVELSEGSAADDVDEDWNYTEDIEPGDSIRCSRVYELRSDSPVEFEICGYGYDADGNRATIAKIFALN